MTKRTFNIDVGDLPFEQAQQFIEAAVLQFRTGTLPYNKNFAYLIYEGGLKQDHPSIADNENQLRAAWIIEVHERLTELQKLGREIYVSRSPVFEHEGTTYQTASKSVDTIAEALNLLDQESTGQNLFIYSINVYRAVDQVTFQPKVGYRIRYAVGNNPTKKAK